MYFLALLALFGLWTGLTLLNQFPGDRWKAWKRFDSFNLVPKWTFFAPTPGTGDLCLLYRLQRVSGEMTPFRELPIFERHTPLNCLFNPRKRLKKQLLDGTRALSKSIQRGTIHAGNLKWSLGYIMALNLVNRVEADCGVFPLIQIMVLRVHGDDSRSVSTVLLSELHERCSYKP